MLGVLNGRLIRLRVVARAISTASRIRGWLTLQPLLIGKRQAGAAPYPRKSQPFNRPPLDAKLLPLARPAKLLEQLESSSYERQR